MERRRTTLSKKKFKNVLSNLEEDESPLGLWRLLNEHWAEFIGQNKKASGKPGDAAAARRWLLKRATEKGVQALPPFGHSCEDLWRQRFGLPTAEEIKELGSQRQWSGKRHRPGDDTFWVKNVSMNKIDNWK